LKKVRLFGSSNCQNCIEAIVFLKKAKIDFSYIDAFDEDEKIQKLCDIYNVDALPHIQFFDNKGEILYEHKGEIDSDKFLKYMIDYYSL